MHKNPLRVQSSPTPLPLATDPLWPQLPIAHRRQCHDLITELLLHVIHSESSKEKNDERQD
jgi:hypothetical protein